MATTALVFGSTGAVGSHILSTLLSSETFSTVKTISRRVPKTTPSSPTKLETIIEQDTSKWASPLLGNLTPPPTVTFNAVGTTRAIAGSIQAQWKIDHDLCIDIANAAKQAGVRVFVFISSAGTRGVLTGLAPYSKMKVGVEDAIQKLEFEQTIVLRPGFILGQREIPKAPVAEKIVSNLWRVSPWLQDSLGQDREIIGRAAVAAAQLALEGKAPSKHWILDQAAVVKYGRDEWKQ